MIKKIFMAFSLIIFTLSIFLIAAPPPGEKGEESLEDRCHQFCSGYMHRIQYVACMDGCVNRPK